MRGGFENAAAPIATRRYRLSGNPASCRGSGRPHRILHFDHAQTRREVSVPGGLSAVGPLSHKPPLWLTRPHAGLLFPQASTQLFCLGLAAGCVTELLRSNVSSVTRGAIMSLERPARSRLAWSNRLAWWWSLLTLVSAINIAAWFSLYHYLQKPPSGSTSGGELMLLLCAAYVFGCAFRSFLPRADVQRICLFDTWLSSVMIGR